MMNFCTLFDSNYIDKGMALYQSLQREASNFNLFVFCFDDKCFEIMSALNWQNAILIHYSIIETPELLRIKEQRSRAEYCWTCTPIIIEYVLDKYDVPSCTYLDSDLFFFSDPQILFNEIKSAGADAVIVEHRFKKNVRYSENIKKYGKYCVQFNFFNSSLNGRKILKRWKEQCIECCSYNKKEGFMGDQKYLDTWINEFENVHELQHLGGGVAPWNLRQYQIGAEGYTLKEIETKVRFQLVFYHFQNIRYISDTVVNIKSQTRDKLLKHKIYIPYLRQLEINKTLLEERFKLEINHERACSNIKWVAFMQKYVMNYKLSSLSDIINLKKLNPY